MLTTCSSRKIEDIFSQLPQLETARLILRKMTIEDAQDLYEYAKDPQVSKYTLWQPHKSMDESINFLKYVINNYEKHNVENWGMVHKQTDKFIGTCGYFLWEPEYSRAEIQYAMSDKYSGMGLMTEAVNEVIKFGFEKMRLNRISAKCMIENVASERVMQKTGMKFEGIMREGVFAKGKFYDLKVYAILRADWTTEEYQK